MLALASSLFAEIKVIESQKVHGYYISTVCIDGYKFVIGSGAGTSAVQVYKPGYDGVATPIKCLGDSVWK